MKLADTIEMYILFKQAENLSPKTITWYRNHLGVFSDWITPCQPVSEIKSVDIARYMAAQGDPKRAPRRLAPYTLRARYSVIRAFFNWCEESEEVGKPPSPIGHGKHKKVKPPKTGQPATKYVPYRDYKRFVASIQPNTWQQARDRLIAIILFWTGVRLQELIDLRVDDIDMDRGLLAVREGKGRRSRYIPFAIEIVRPALLQYLYMRPIWKGPELWLGEPANLRHKVIRPLKPEGVRQILIRRCHRASIPYYHPHAWRHAFGEWLINAGVSLAAVSAILGHSSVTVTEAVYAHIRTPAIKREYAAAVNFMMELDLKGGDA